MWMIALCAAEAQPTEQADDDVVTYVTDRRGGVGRGSEVLLSFGAAYGAYAGAETGFLLGEVLEETESGHTTQGIRPGLLGGAAVGLGTAYLVSLGNKPSYEAQTLLYTTSAHGVLYGVQVGRAFIGPDEPGRTERIHAAGLAGSILGVGLGAAFGRQAASFEDQARFTLATGVGWLTASGINDLAGVGLVKQDPDGDGIIDQSVFDSRPRAAVTLATTAAMGGLGVIANRTGARPGPRSLGLSLGHGAWIGGWSPLLFDDDPSTLQVLGGVRLGLGVGYGGALLLSAFGEPSGRSVGMQTAGWAAGSAVGAGIPLAVSDEDAPLARIVGPMLAAGIGGQVLGAALAPRYDLDSRDAVLLGALGTWTTYQTVGWGIYANATSPNTRRPVGYALTAAGTGSLVTLGLAPVLDVEPSGSMMLLSAGGWGTWYGGWGATLADFDQDTAWLTMLTAGNGALLGTGVALGAGWKPSWSDLGAIDGLGLVGAAAGALTGVVFLYERDDFDPLVRSTLVGSTAGLVAGGIVAAIDKEDRLPSVGRLRLDGWQGAVSALPLRGADGSLGGMVTLNLEEVE